MLSNEFVRSFCTCFALLGLRLLFGDKPVTMGSVVLLACVSAAVGSAWTGGGGEWVEVSLGSFFNTSTLHEVSDSAAEGMLRAFLGQLGVSAPQGEEVE